MSESMRWPRRECAKFWCQSNLLKKNHLFYIIFRCDEMKVDHFSLISINSQTIDALHGVHCLRIIKMSTSEVIFINRFEQ